MELKLQVFKQSLEGFDYLANVDYKSLQGILDVRLIDIVKLKKILIISEAHKSSILNCDFYDSCD